MKIFYTALVFCMSFLILPPVVSASPYSTSPTAKVEGKVVDVNGAPLIGVTIIKKSTSSGTLSDIDGKFSMEVEKGDILVASYLGMQPNEQVYEGQAFMTFVMRENTEYLEEVVVVGYGAQKKSDLTGAVGVVEMDALEKRAAGTIDQSLQGQIPGVMVTSNSGSPGGGMMIRIRGIGTLNSSSPLFVVDGMMVDDIDFLNPKDIASIQVLKDASATAIYGARGSNGVVIVETNKGSQGSTISLNSYYGVQNFTRTTNVLDGPTWGYLRNEAMLAAGNPAPISDPSTLPTTDWFQEIANEDAPIHSVDFSIGGASDRTNYFISLNNFSQDGIIHKTGFDRTSFRANSSFKVNNWLKVGENISLAKANYESGVEADEYTSMIITAIAKDPVSPVRTADGDFASGIYNDTWNPAAIIEYNNATSEQYRALGNVFADVSILPQLVFRSSYSFEYSFNENDSFEPVYYVSSVQQNSTSRLGKGNSNKKSGQWSNTLTYTTSMDRHNITGLVGMEYFNAEYLYNGISVNDLPSDNPDIRFIDNAAGSNAATVYGGRSEVKQLSALARVNYEFDNRFLVTANFRADASSKFAKNNRWGYFPSFSAGWRIGEEDFFKNIKGLSDLKVRVGWGQIGNQGSVSPYQDVTTASTGANYLWGGSLAPGSVFASSGNKEIRWETSTTTNAGIDFGFFDGRITGTVDYFVKNTTGMLLAVPVPGQTGIQSPPVQNAGEMKNSGLELALNYSNRKNKLNYSFGVNFAKINNEVIDLGADDAFIDGAFFQNSFYITRTAAGRPMAQFYGLKTDGLFQNQAEIDAQTAQQNVAPGDVRYVDADNDGELDLFFLGSPLPDFTYAFNANVGYGGFDLSVQLQGVQGNEVFNGTAFYTRSSTANWNLGRDMTNRWTGEGTQNDAKYPRMNASDVNNSRMSDRYLEDGSYLRIKNLQLGYTFSGKLKEWVPLQSVRVYLNAQNLHTFTNYSGFDPEIGLRNYDPLDIGVDRGFYPQARTYTFGLNVTF